ncbi:hypothetical protein LL912_00680 [Niabella sp. CC-SYL272]|uniref:hypothetical protein n=1 Tax=Niabella agricola TaxID=2891571 RepID=UPI001F227330|nr:hypothetical protein [Niabella agricola]MCF3107281.1 hypothetical protein [Niabella agricola]
MAEKIFVGGFRGFAKNDKAPDWVIGDALITIDEFKAFINSNQQYLTEYNGKKQLKIQVTRAQNGSLSFTVNTYQKQDQSGQTHPIMQGPATPVGAEELPF